MAEAQDDQENMNIDEHQDLAPLPAASTHTLFSCCLPIACAALLLLRSECGWLTDPLGTDPRRAWRVARRADLRRRGLW